MIMMTIMMVVAIVVVTVVLLITSAAAQMTKQPSDQSEEEERGGCSRHCYDHADNNLKHKTHEGNSSVDDNRTRRLLRNKRSDSNDYTELGRGVEEETRALLRQNPNTQFP